MAKKSRRSASQSPAGDEASRADSRRAQRVLQERQAKRRRIYTMFGGAAAAALILVVILVLINQDDTGTMAGEPITVPTATYEDIPREGRTLGDPDAPVTVIEYGDFQCPGCAAFATTVKPQLVNDYIADGQVYFVSRDLTGLGDESREAAIAASCALEQDMYWEFYDILYANQAGRDEGAFSEERLIRMAELLEMDVEAFEDCLGSDRFDDELEAMREMAVEDNVRATPTVIVNGVALEGPTYEQLRQQIETALQEAGS